MRVQEKASASCAKMTEERSINGDVPSGSKRGFALGNADGAQSPNLTATTDTDRSSSSGGGRLKFFKDGKFILELSHRKEGDRNSWVPVLKKTYWPPPGAAGTPRQESSTSLSVSDDNSSVQSSPWQRDHCWKQSNPRHNISKEMTFVMQPLRHMLYIRNLQVIRKKRRCPYDPTEVNAISINNMNNGKLARVKRECTNPARLSVIVQTLWEKVHSRMDPSIISPRKRILRELERVTLEDSPNSKRQRARTTSALPQNINNGSNSNCTVTCQTLQPPVTTKGSVSNYSITSLLAPSRDEDIAPAGAAIQQDGEPSFLRNLLKSASPEPRLRTPVVPSMGNTSHAPNLSPFLTPPLLYAPPLTSPYLPHTASPLGALPLYPGLVPPFQAPQLSPCPWGPMTHQPLDDFKKDDGVSDNDVPLNLSKHAG
ncbi:hypothetical protein L9F63_016961 [Diploptera punctata]|uniref:Uncharacterized protein n=1 Tax=Diploptera punctata TaxID=6984 RepID=A0AAD8EGP0_DIPPU|nr:hypothetical protein L9F63_016961 [Diploptera punctata]